MITYIVVKKGNGKFAPRMKSSIGEVWFKEPFEYDLLCDAITAITVKKKAHDMREAEIKEEVVFTLN